MNPIKTAFAPGCALMLYKPELAQKTHDVVVYCVSCTKSIFIGRKKPHYLIDLLFNQQTVQQTLDPDLWHKELDDYIAVH